MSKFSTKVSGKLTSDEARFYKLDNARRADPSAFPTFLADTTESEKKDYIKRAEQRRDDDNYEIKNDFAQLATHNREYHYFGWGPIGFGPGPMGFGYGPFFGPGPGYGPGPGPGPHGPGL